jgi:rhomboid protease GluP
MFLHGGVTHLLTNVYSLQAVGNDVEQYFGAGRYLFTYLLSGVVANYVSAVKTPNPSLGASGAVFGIVGAYYVFLNRNMVSDATIICTNNF